MSEIKTRVFVDEEWKARVQREKEEMRLKSETKQGQTKDTAEGGSAEDGIDPLFEALLNMLATQVMYCLGFIGTPGQTQVVVNLEQAKESIDMLVMLRKKTEGNLTSQERSMFADTLAELQRLFAARLQQAQAQAAQQAGIDMNALRG